MPPTDRASFGEWLLDHLGERPPHVWADLPPWAIKVVWSDARRVKERHLDELLAKGWSVADVFGAHPTAPWNRLDASGLVFGLRDGKILSITEAAVMLETHTGATLRFLRPSAR